LKIASQFSKNSQPTFGVVAARPAFNLSSSG
jgi:hypothetical protein